jgi:ERCC4-type nuclease
MTIQIDSREKARAIKQILVAFDKAGIDYFVSKLYVGDYQSYDNPYLIIDRKQNLTELCSNVTHGHERFRRELIRAQEHGIQLVILCEHGENIESLEDVIFWENPRRKKRRKIAGKWQTIETKATTGETLYKILQTLIRKYGVRIEFCDKEHTGQKIIEVLNDDA